KSSLILIYYEFLLVMISESLNFRQLFIISILVLTNNHQQSIIIIFFFFNF
ncbi:hypothetical protein pb186bvf_021050, partial [Paramecium bursaria]